MQIIKAKSQRVSRSTGSLIRGAATASLPLQRESAGSACNSRYACLRQLDQRQDFVARLHVASFNGYRSNPSCNDGKRIFAVRCLAFNIHVQRNHRRYAFRGRSGR